ncbi:carboxymuconolactone decarboxylase family protein [Paenibacillus sp. BR1-192]|uniref:carboxymuconolactone decarboxylase family protein n=1 Tax=Paenibacillus sp. BR1-192 TaxID=3032287 RepID=UPI003219FC9D
MSDSKELTVAQRAIGDFAPKMVELTDEVLFGDIWKRKELSSRDRSLITVSSLITGGNTQQLKNHLNLEIKRSFGRSARRSDDPSCFLCRLAKGDVSHNGRKRSIRQRELTKGSHSVCW